MQKKKQYVRLTAAEREEISRGIAQRESIIAIADHMGRVASTVYREVKRNSGKGEYRAFAAGNRADRAASSRRSGRSRLAAEDRLRNYVIEKLGQYWSPVEIASRMKEEYPFDMAMRISHEAIYRYIYVLPRGSLKQTLILALRREHAYRRKRKKVNHEETRGRIADMLSIEERPKEVEDRTVPGHWEGDLIMGKYKRTALGTLVERTTRFTILVPLKAKDAESVRKAYAREMGSLPKEVINQLICTSHDLI